MRVIVTEVLVAAVRVIVALASAAGWAQDRLLDMAEDVLVLARRVRG